ncbi:MAG: 16S rRNA (cytosine(1402)-N(4))-methyltransferase [Candidatus Yanofskybacteria bacterium RIFCSPHIGHO2_02_FULL_50_12]|uniref:Ribosomal RNA small subunit methyltransferase H n=1 Tax=Candidatus Yanofskybacteria bacterium RIFCSPHIGHO2_02_FULL_50_12 TaxID=1802685 RepID=A0A1F8FXA3_9BACT|nr:MAG: 16S rRNA (cytosine(1402)-N(4))-methyltransferase [Candidatus Yanofskybacteria bacterium RIFCSPHIGHO2_02_FULL_50_12]
MSSIHEPVLLQEVLEFLDPRPGKNFIDATLNGGGHTRALVERIMPQGRVLGIEWDPEVAKMAAERAAQSLYENNIIVVNDSYVNMSSIAERFHFRPDGILFDLGLSSWHYESSGRGFSFKRDEPLDMRFNSAAGPSAAELINTYEVAELEQILRDYGDEQFSHPIAAAIGKARWKKPIMTVPELVAVVESAVPNWYKHRKIHFATKTFQALRVIVNDELANVKIGILAAIDLLPSGGKLAVISFQGHEDKIVRELFKQKTKEGIIEIPIKRTIRPKWEEQKINPRSRSAKMKVALKI